MPNPTYDLGKFLETKNSLEEHGLIVERVNGDVRANVPHIQYHSNGFECGYAGSGPADLAMAVMHALIPPPTKADEDKLYEIDMEAFEKADADPSLWSVKVGPKDIRVSRLAHALHQTFKQRFIATMSRDGGHIPIETIREFIETETARLKEREAS